MCHFSMLSTHLIAKIVFVHLLHCSTHPMAPAGSASTNHWKQVPYVLEFEPKTLLVSPICHQSIGGALISLSAGLKSGLLQTLHAGVQASHRAVKAIGRGAAADTWLFMDKKRNRLVAVKLFQRPIPDALRDSTVREITVRLSVPQDPQSTDDQPLPTASSSRTHSADACMHLCNGL